MKNIFILQFFEIKLLEKKNQLENIKESKNEILII